MSIENIERLLREIREVFLRNVDDPGVSRIVQSIRGELPGIRERMFKEERLSRIIQHFKERDFAIISAFRKGVPESENLERQFQLTKDVRAKGLGYIPIVGRWERVHERSLFVPDMTREEAIDLGVKYGQDAVIWGSRGEAELIDLRTGKTLLKFRRIRVLDVDKAFDDYSALRLVKGVPVRPFRLEPEERDRVVEHELEHLGPGDVVYAEPSDRLTGMRFLIWDPLCLYRFVKREGDEIHVIPLGEEPEPVTEGARVSRLLRDLTGPVRVLNQRVIGRILRVAGPSAGIS